MDYQQAIRWIIERSDYDRGFISNPFAGDEGAALGLRRTDALLEALGRPEHEMAIVHVAGTKGKGSTSAMIAAIARGNGRRVGMFSSPHLHSFRERFMVAGEPISEAEFASAMTTLEQADTDAHANHPDIGRATAFEISTALALLAFRDAGCDLVVLETGLGGRLDATNVVDPDVAVITTISYDHMAILGDTLTEIAFEKGGIIKPRRPVAIGVQQREALEELRRIAVQRDAPAMVAGVDWRGFAGPWGRWPDIELSLEGAHQRENAGLALMACWLLDPELLRDESVVRRALAHVDWPGRYEQIAAAPFVIVDGAHNVDSMRRLVETVQEDQRARQRMFVILGVSRDKDVDGMLDALRPLHPTLIVTASHSPRAATPGPIVSAAVERGFEAIEAESMADALTLAQQRATPSDFILITGSLYVVAEAREAYGLAETPAFERNLLA